MTNTMNTNSTSNRIPRNQLALIALALKTRVAAETYGPEVDLEHNTAGPIAVDLYDLIGDPATPEVDGKEGLYAAAKEAVTSARGAARQANKAGQDFCRQAIGLLKPFLGNVYNSAWETAGFLGRSLAAPKYPVAMLTILRHYFERHPAHANDSLGLTAAGAVAQMNAITAAELALTTADGARLNAKAARDASVRRLFERMLNLRGELEQLLADNDGRWYDFGFNRPVDSRMPAPVTGLVATPLAPGVVRLAWDLSTLAVNYRVSWKLTISGAEWIEVGLFTDRSCTLTGLPSGSEIAIGVSARNKSGETAPTVVQITVP
jgi:hypothetical protein